MAKVGETGTPTYNTSYEKTSCFIQLDAEVVATGLACLTAARNFLGKNLLTVRMRNKPGQGRVAHDTLVIKSMSFLYQSVVLCAKRSPV